MSAMLSALLFIDDTLSVEFRPFASLSVFTLMFDAFAPKQAITDSAVAQQENGCYEDDAAHQTWLALQEESDQVENDEHHVGVHQRWICGLRDDQQRYKTLQTVHFWQLYIYK